MKGNSSHQISYTQWFPTEPEEENRYDGKCGRCERLVPAIDLELRIRPFGKGDWWVCKGGCEGVSTNLDKAVLRELRKMLREEGKL